MNILESYKNDIFYISIALCVTCLYLYLLLTVYIYSICIFHGTDRNGNCGISYFELAG